MLLLTWAHGSRSLAPAAELRGDADGNGELQLTDAVRILNVLFLGTGVIPCFDRADTDNNGELQLTDAVRILNVLFLGTGTIPPLSLDEINACRGLDPVVVERGMKEFEQADPNGNLFTCATCHSMAPDSETEVLRPGHTLLNSLGRPSFKDGGRTNFVGAANVCREDWMQVCEGDPDCLFTPWAENDRRFTDLVAFIQSLSPEDTAPALEYEIVAPAKTGPATGNAQKGCELFNRSCMVCHGMGGGGTPNRLGPTLLDVASLCTTEDGLCLKADCKPIGPPDDCPVCPPSCLDNPDYVRYRIRLSGPNKPDTVYHVPQGFQLAGTTMPFWTKDKLTDEEVEDLTSFILEARDKARQGQTFDCGGGPGPEGNVLRSGVIDGRFSNSNVRSGSTQHAVAGTVEELDTHKIRIKNFSYNGGGIEVHVFLFKQGNILGGKNIGPDIFGQAMSNTTFVVDIPAAITSDSFDAVSIWCKSAKQDFGSALIAPLP